MLQKLITKNLKKNQRFLKFILNGLVATFVHYVAMLLISNYLIPVYSVAYGLASIIGILTSFLGNKFIVFTHLVPFNKKNKRTFVQLKDFIMLYFLIMLFCSFLMGILSDLLKINYNLCFIIAVGVQTLLSFYGNKHYVFKV